MTDEKTIYAFPHKRVLHYKATAATGAYPPGSTYAEPVFTETEGMELRDYIAIAAMQGMLANPEVLLSVKKSGESFCKIISGSAYEHADAMLKARGE